MDFYKTKFAALFSRPKNPGEVQRDYASNQSIKIQTNKAKWNKGFIYEKGSPHKR
jgi:hypothetical protein